MTIFVCALIALATAAAIARPLLTAGSTASQDLADASGELWQREKSVAMVAIKEADFDKATGKLSDEDYAELRADYEERALHAIDELDQLSPPAAASAGAAAAGSDTQAVFCTSCGTSFGEAHSFCASCGSPRA